MLAFLLIVAKFFVGQPSVNSFELWVFYFSPTSYNKNFREVYVN